MGSQHALSRLILQTPCQIGDVVPALQKRKLRLREAQCFPLDTQEPRLRQGSNSYPMPKPGDPQPVRSSVIWVRTDTQSIVAVGAQEALNLALELGKGFRGVGGRGGSRDEGPMCKRSVVAKKP